jgi:hypothetical protein
VFILRPDFAFYSTLLTFRGRRLPLREFAFSFKATTTLALVLCFSILHRFHSPKPLRFSLTFIALRRPLELQTQSTTISGQRRRKTLGKMNASCRKHPDTSLSSTDTLIYLPFSHSTSTLFYSHHSASIPPPPPPPNFPTRPVILPTSLKPNHLHSRRMRLNILQNTPPQTSRTLHLPLR